LARKLIFISVPRQRRHPNALSELVFHTFDRVPVLSHITGMPCIALSSRVPPLFPSEKLIRFLISALQFLDSLVVVVHCRC
jgi:hypothetical protein